MESTTGTLVYIKTKIKSIREEFEKVHVSGVGKDAIFTERSLGYFVAFEGSQEAIYFGDAPPPTWSVGDEIKITFTKGK